MRGRVTRVRLSLAALHLAALTHVGIHSSAHAADPQVKIEVMSLFVAEPGAETQIPIRITLPDTLPKTAYVRIRGLPASVTLSDGYAVTSGVWSVPLIGLPGLKVIVPKSVSGRSELALSVLTVDGQILAEAKSALLVAQVSVRAPAPEPSTKSEPPKSESPRVAAVEPPPATLVRPELVRPERPMKADMAPTFPAPSGATTIPTPMPAPPAAATPPPEPPKSEAKPAEPKSQVAAVTPPVPPAPPPVSSETIQRNDRLTEQGDKALAQGNVSTARQFYLRAADAGSSAAALKLAETYDPAELSRLRVQGLVGDVAEARRWYERARDLGAAAAADKLARLAGR